MKAFLGPALLIAALASAVAVNAQSAAPVPTPAAIVPGSLSGSRPAGSPQPSGAVPPTPGPSQTAVDVSPSPSPTSSDRFHLHRPGTDVDGDALSGNAASDAYVFRGNVVLHSDPKVDRALGGATESDDPITVTADEIDIDRSAMTYVAKGHVHFVQGSRSAHADVATLNEQTHSLDLLGNADVLEGEHRARAAKMHYNLADRQFHGVGDVRIYQPVPTPNPVASGTPAPKRKRRLPF